MHALFKGLLQQAADGRLDTGSLAGALTARRGWVEV